MTHLWVHTADAATGNKVGFLDVQPAGAANSLIDDGKAQLATVGGRILKKSIGDVSWKGKRTQYTDANFQPVFTKPPTITGATPVGSLLTCHQGEWTANPVATPSYAWRRGTETIIGENASVYTTAIEDSGMDVTCMVMLTNTQGTDVSMTNAITVD